MRIVIAYASKDEKEKVEFQKQLLPLTVWDSSQISPGAEFDEEIRLKFGQANCVLLLLSPDLLANEELLKPICDLHFRKETQIVPIILRYCSWEESAFGTLQALPPDGKPIVQNDGQENKRYYQVASAFKQMLLGNQRSTEGLPALHKSIKLPARPYMGLTWFHREDAPVFFGRNREIKDLILLIRQPEFSIIALHGPSGVGKSSLLDAGVLPRLEAEYFITYRRREKEPGLAVILREELDRAAPDSRKRLIILDQLEEIFTNPNPQLPDEKERFFQLLFQAIEQDPERKFLFGFRKEYFTDLKQWVYDHDLEWTNFALGPLDRESVMEAVNGAAQNLRLREKYGLQIAEDLPYTIASDILKDKDSHIAPLLQILLRKMWDAVEPNPSSRIFDADLYAQFQENSLDSLLSTQMEALRKTHPESVSSGLTLDLLDFFTTETFTAAQRSENELTAAYAHLPNILELKESLKGLYLLADTDDQQYTRLGHDSLARLVVAHCARSNMPGQQATRTLEYALNTNTGLSKAALLEVQAGSHGRRVFSEKEQEIMEAGLQEHFKALVKDLIGQNNLDEAFDQLYIVFEKKRNIKDLDALYDIEKRHRSEKNKFFSGLLSYEESLQVRNMIQQHLIELIDNIDTDEKISDLQKVFTEIASGNLTTALSLILDFSEKNGDPKWINQSNLAYSNCLELQQNYNNGLMYSEEYWMLSSRMTLTLSDFIYELILSFQQQKKSDLISIFLGEDVHKMIQDEQDLEFKDFLDQVELIREKQNTTDSARNIYLILFLASLGRNQYRSGLVSIIDYQILRNVTLDTLAKIGNHAFSITHARNQWLAAGKPQLFTGPDMLLRLSQNRILEVYNSLMDLLEYTDQPEEVKILHMILDRYFTSFHKISFLLESYDKFIVNLSRTIWSLSGIILDHAFFKSLEAPGIDLPSLYKDAILKKEAGLIQESLLVFTPLWDYNKTDDLGHIVVLSTKYLENEQRIKTGTISFSDYRRQIAQISHTLTDLCEPYITKEIMESRLPTSSDIQDKDYDAEPSESMFKKALENPLELEEELTTVKVLAKLSENDLETAISVMYLMAKKYREQEIEGTVLLLMGGLNAEKRNLRLGMITDFDYSMRENRARAYLLETCKIFGKERNRKRSEAVEL